MAPVVEPVLQSGSAASVERVLPCAAPTAVPDDGVVTLRTLAVAARVDPDIIELLFEHFGFDDDDLECAAALPAARVESELNLLATDHDVPLAQLGRLHVFFKRLRGSACTAMVSPPAAPPQVPLVEAPPVQRHAFNEVLDPVDKGFFVDLTAEERGECRRRYKDAVGGSPAANREPSSLQLAALYARVAAGRSPFADFALFTPHGARFVRLHRFDAQIFLDNALTTKPLPWPQRPSILEGLLGCLPCIHDLARSGFASRARWLRAWH